MWTIEKLQQYIDDQAEKSLHLEYKASDSLIKSEGKKNKISKNISAFFNLDDRSIVYEIKEYQSGIRLLPKRSDPVNKHQFP